MRVAISAPDNFVAPYLREALGEAAVEIPPEALAEGGDLLSSTPY